MTNHTHIVTTFRIVALKCRRDMAFDTRENGTNSLGTDVIVNATECQETWRAMGFAMKTGVLC